MYLMGADVYMCDYCQNEFSWEDETGVHGNVLGCANCSQNFCEKCFKEIMGNDISHVCSDGIPRCPDCIRKIRSYTKPSMVLPKSFDMGEKADKEELL